MASCKQVYVRKKLGSWTPLYSPELVNNFGNLQSWARNVFLEIQKGIYVKHWACLMETGILAHNMMGVWSQRWSQVTWVQASIDSFEGGFATWSGAASQCFSAESWRTALKPLLLGWTLSEIVDCTQSVIPKSQEGSSINDIYNW